MEDLKLEDNEWIITTIKIIKFYPKITRPCLHYRQGIPIRWLRLRLHANIVDRISQVSKRSRITLWRHSVLHLYRYLAHEAIWAFTLSMKLKIPELSRREDSTARHEFQNCPQKKQEFGERWTKKTRTKKIVPITHIYSAKLNRQRHYWIPEDVFGRL